MQEDKHFVYCNDRNLASGQAYSITKVFVYAPYERIYTNKQPTYNCTNMSDAFSVNNTSAKLDYPIGLMSIDELSYAGGQAFTTLDAPYAWYYTNANGESSYGSVAFWALSPFYWDGSYSGVWYVDGSDYPGLLNLYNVDDTGAVRPSVSLSSCNLISRGDGSANNPYVVYIGSGSC
ncbi:unknown [Clostridium sp. CAG:628]|nr:unknown [Clostridium sp. CAG:628]